MGWLSRMFQRDPPRRQARSFTAARVDRLTASWLATTASINQELRSDLDRLRARARDLAKNNDYARKFVRMVVTNVAGPDGFTLQARVEDAPGRPDTLANRAIEAGFADWSRRGVCEVSGRMSFPDLLRALMAGWGTDGEYLVRRVRGAAAGNAYGYALQLLDVDRIDTNLNLAAASGRNAIVMGIEIDAFRRPVAYHLFTAHPADGAQGGRQRERVPAEDIFHGYEVEHAEQVRGVPPMAAAMLSLHNLGEFEKSALLAARKGADTLGFFVSPNGEPPSVGQETDANGEAIQVSVPGTYDTLPDGYDFRPNDSRYPDAMMADFVKGYLRRIASGLNVAYNGLANDLEGVNFSSIRSGVIDERDQWMIKQQWLTESLLRPLFEEWLSAALLSGRLVMPNGSPLPASKRDKFSAHAWQGRRWQWVDPVKDIEAARLAIKSGVSSPQRIAAQQGLDVEDVLVDLRRFEEAAAGVSLIDYGTPPAAPAPAAPVSPPEEKQLTVHNHIHPADVRVDNHVQPASAEVRVEVQPSSAPAVTIENRVEAPEINVNAPVDVHVPAAQVEILPAPVAAEETIERDGNGDIARIIRRPVAH